MRARRDERGGETACAGGRVCAMAVFGGVQTSSAGCMFVALPLVR
jgi:hypothetical protein